MGEWYKEVNGKSFERNWYLVGKGGSVEDVRKRIYDADEEGMSEKEYDEAVAAVEEYLKREKYSDIVDAYKNARKYEYTEWHKQYCKVWYPNAYKEILIYEELVRRREGKNDE